MINKIFNKVTGYVASRYLIYGIQFVNTIILARLLSPFEFGVWGFSQLIITYFSHLDFGIPSSFTSLSSIHKKKTRYVKLNFSAALTMMIILSILVLSLFGIFDFFNIEFGEKYRFTSYVPLVLVIIVVSYLNKLYINLFRIFDHYWEITFSQASVPLSSIVVYLFFDKDLVYYLLGGFALANILSLLIFIVNSPFSFSINFSKKILIRLQKSGLFYFIYNTSFYFVLLSLRSVIGSNYSVEEFGVFNFAFSMATIIELLVTSFVFLIFPKMINHLAKSSLDAVKSTLNRIQMGYSVFVSFISYLAISVFPLFISFFPTYSESISAFSVLVLTKLILSNGFGSPILLMAKGREAKLALMAFCALSINVISTVFMASVLNFDYEYVILGTGIAYFFYVLSVNRLSLFELEMKTNAIELISKSFPLSQSLPLVIALIASFTSFSHYIYPIVFVVFCLLNFKSMKVMKREITTLFAKTNVIGI